MSSLKNKTPANTYNDLIHINNNNEGVDSSLRYVYSGKGQQLPIQISNNKVSIDFGNGDISNVSIENYRKSLNDLGSIAVDTGLDFSQYNCFKFNITNNINITFTFSLDSSYVYEYFIIVQQDAVPRTINWPVSVSWEGGSPPDISTANDIYIIKIYTFDSGVSFFGKLDLQATP